MTYCHSRTVDLAAHVASADVVIAAVGVPELIKGGAWIKPGGAVVIDAGGYNEATSEMWSTPLRSHMPVRSHQCRVASAP